MNSGLKFSLSLAITFLIWLSSFTLPAQAQENKSYYWNTIQDFKKQDSINPLPKRSILMVGSSSFTNWHNVQQMFPGYMIVNRGFGGSQLLDVKQYFEVVKYPKKLKQIVIYAGDNDIAAGATAELVLERVKSLINLIRKDEPKVQITYLSIKGCPGRAASIPIVRQANDLIKKFISEQKKLDYADIFSATMDPAGNPIPGIYVEDGVHLNEKGYAIWAEVLKPHLKK
ncbi:GDSL-type esterase/lipase family protein [Desertivirga arenae]|uniref:GDSL-type esterase/lipase family protein n=1 Tax=Desertivirga arenae TaxID=2810309 RepID=UPI001A964595|nr:GDSL-type esterase/lipase family protein [Pedobacter sp. SYSU D00823]